jgi:trafficking protein particle complex subunit 5
MSEFRSGGSFPMTPLGLPQKLESELAQQTGSQRMNIYEKSIMRNKGSVSTSIFALLFSEMVQYSQSRVDNLGDLERKLEENGYGIGQRLIELVGCRERITKRETKIVNMLQYVTNVIWKHLFNKVADNLERSMDNQDEYMIHEMSPITNTFVSVPDDMGSFNCASFIAGIIAGVLDSAMFPATVTAHLVNQEDGSLPRTVYLIKFKQEVVERET